MGRSTFVVCSIIFVFLSGCTWNKQNNTKSNVKFQVPTKMVKTGTVGAMATGDLQHLIINVHGPGISPVKYCSWDRKQDGSTRTSGGCVVDASGSSLADGTASVNVVLDVPPGDSRFIQVLLAYDASTETATMAMDLFYGGVAKALPSGDVAVELPIERLNTTVSNPAMVRGRFMTSSTSGPSGLVDVRVKAKSDHPSMTLMMAEMLSGWFEAMVFETIPVEIKVNDQLLFGKAMLKSDFDAMVGAKVASSSSGGESEYVGFFGDEISTSGKSACTTTCTGQEYVDHLKLSSYWRGPFRGNISMDQASMTWVLLPGIQESIDSLRVFRQASIDAAFVGKYVIDHGVYDCEAMRTDLGEGMTLDKSATTLSWAQLGGFNSTTDFLAICPVRGARLLTNAFIHPDMHSGGNLPYFRVEVSGAGMGGGDTTELMTDQCYPTLIRAYTYDGMSANEFFNATDSAWAQVLSASGWAEFYGDPNCTNPATPSSFEVPIGSAESAQFYMRLDPSVVNGTLYSFAMTGLPTEVGYQPEHNQVLVTSPVYAIYGPSPAGVGLCYPYQVRVQTQSGSPINVPGTTMVSILDGGGAPANIYNTLDNCRAGASPSSANINNGSSQGAFFYKPTGAYSLKATTASAQITIADSSLFSGTVDNQSASIYGVQLVASTYNAYWGSCIWAEGILKNEVGTEVGAKARLEFPLDVSGIGFGLKVYDNGDCMTERTLPLIFWSGMSRVGFYIKFDGVAPVGTTVSFRSPRPDLAVTGSISPAIPTGTPFARIQPPSFDSAVIGLHEFSPTFTHRVVPIIVASGTTAALECETSPDTWQASPGAPCASSLASQTTLNWDQGDAMAGRRLRLVASKTGFADEHHIFNPAALFKNGFKVMPCDYVVTTNTGDLITTVGNGSLVSGGGGTINVYGRICVAQGVTVSHAATLSFGMSGALVGWSDKSSLVRNSDLNLPLVDVTTSSDTYLANLNIGWTGAAIANVSMVNLSSVSTGKNTFENLVLEGVSNNSGIVAFNLISTSVSHVTYISKVDAKLGNDGIFVRVNLAEANIFASRLLSGAAASSPVLAFDFVGSTGTNAVEASGFVIRNLANTGPGAVVLTSSTSVHLAGASLSLKDSLLDTTNTVATPVAIKNNTSIDLISSVLHNDSAFPAIESLGKTGVLTLSGSTVVSLQDGPAIQFNPDAAAGSHTSYIGGTEFIRAGVGTNASSALVVIGTNFGVGETVSISNPNGDYVGSLLNNTFCGTAGAAVWGGIVLDASGKFSPGPFDPTGATVGAVTSAMGQLHCR
jgi:hypothetical protein